MCSAIEAENVDNSSASSCIYPGDSGMLLPTNLWSSGSDDFFRATARHKRAFGGRFSADTSTSERCVLGVSFASQMCTTT